MEGRFLRPVAALMASQESKIGLARRFRGGGFGGDNKFTASSPLKPHQGRRPPPSRGQALGTLHLERLDGRGPCRACVFERGDRCSRTHRPGTAPSRPTILNGWIAKASPAPALGHLTRGLGGSGGQSPPGGVQGRSPCPAYVAMSPAALRVAVTASRAARAIKPQSLAMVQNWKPIFIMRAAYAAVPLWMPANLPCFLQLASSFS